MMQSEFNLVLKYSEALDEFIKIRVFSEENARELVQRAAAGDKANFQREIIRACVSDLNEATLTEVYKDDDGVGILDIEEMLYLLCVDVNPSLDIHQVSIQLSSNETETEASRLPSQKNELDQENNLERLVDIESSLKKEVIGQERAIEIVSKAIKKSAVGLRDPRRPVGAFLFVGHVGVGKTELGKALSEYLYGSQSRLVRVDCSEYALPHEYAKLIGSPPGYIGHNEGGYLTEAAKELDEFIVLFDEIEKAHGKMHNILLQLLDEGMITDSKGFKVSFRNALVLMTSNLGVREVESLRSAIGFDHRNREDTSFHEMQSEINEALKKAFRPEFLNRLDDVIVFNTLTLNDSIKIVDKMFNELSKIANRAGIHITATQRLKSHLAEVGFAPESGARELRRTIKRMVEEPVTDMLINGEISQGSILDLDLDGGRVSIKPVHLEEFETQPTF